MESLVVDEREVVEFVRWLKPLRQHEAYIVVLMIRSAGLREKYGFKGTDHKLDSRVVHGYLDQVIPVETPLGAGVEQWRLRLYESIHRLAVLARSERYYYVRFKPGSSTEIDSVYRVPWQLTSVMIMINPSDTLKAALSTVKEVQEGVWSMARSALSGHERIIDMFRRPDTRYHANAMRHSRTVIHTIDVDNPGLAASILALVTQELGYRPATIKTRRGLHILVDLELLDRLGTINRWVGPVDKSLARLVAEYKQKPSERLRQDIISLAYESRGPLLHRLNALSAVLVNERGGSLVEVKKKSLEPVPGVYYKGVVPRFTPHEA